MAPGWWRLLDLAAWQPAYQAHAALRPELDRLIAARLGHAGAPPADDALADRLLTDAARRDSWCLALGLWALQCPEYLLLRPFRQTLSPALTLAQQTQLLALLPAAPPRTAVLAPALLPAAARQTGAAWLACAAEPTLALCRLLWPPAAQPVPDAPVRPVLTKLARWL